MTSPSWGAPVPGEPDSVQRVQVPPVYGRRPGRLAPRPAAPPEPPIQRARPMDDEPEEPYEPAPASRPVRVRVVERFPGQRVHHRTGPLRRIRSAVALVVTAVIVGAVLAASLTAVVWGISVAIHHATTS